MTSTVGVAWIAGLLALGLMSGCTNQRPPQPTPRSEALPEIRPGVRIDAFDAGVPSVTTTQAFAEIGRSLPVPDAAVEGTPLKVIVDGTATTEDGRIGMMVQYAPDVRLYIQPIEDGQPTKIVAPDVVVAGYPARAEDPVMATWRGTPWEVTPARVIWIIGDMTYRLEATQQSVDLPRLIEIADSTR